MARLGDGDNTPAGIASTCSATQARWASSVARPMRHLVPDCPGLDLLQYRVSVKTRKIFPEISLCDNLPSVSKTSMNNKCQSVNS